jgi:putative DNA primase/helicase
VITLWPVDSQGHCTCHRGTACTDPGKHPTDTGWQNTPEQSGADVEAIWDQKPWAGVGILTGTPSDIWVLDEDPDKGGDASLRSLVETFGDLPKTYQVQTGRGGRHYYFTMPDFDVRNVQSGQSRTRLGEWRGLDVRGTGGFVVAAPSISGFGPYLELENLPTADAPEWLLDLVRPVPTPSPVAIPDRPFETLPGPDQDRMARYVERARQGEIARLQECKDKAVRPGEHYAGPPWNHTTFEVSCQLVELANSTWNLYTQQEAWTDVWNAAPRDAGFGDHEITKTFRSALQRIGDSARPAPAAPSAYGEELVAGLLHGRTPDPAGDDVEQPQYPKQTWDDLGNAKRLVDRAKGVLRYVAEPTSWATYNEGHWRIDNSHTAQYVVQHMIDDLPKQEIYDSPDQQEKFKSWVAKQRSSARVSACITEAKARREFAMSINDFDAQPMYLNAANCVVDLRTGDWLPHHPAQHLMMQTPVPYEPLKPCHRWQQFLDEVMPDIEMQKFLQRVVGYSLTGLIVEEAMFIHHGSGANGKSVFLAVMSHILGDYGQVIPRTTLVARERGEDHPTAVARMRGKRFLQMSESKRGARLDEELVKSLTGTEMITARFMGKDFFDFQPTGKIHYVSNHLPRISPADSIWRRIHLFGWEVVIPVPQQNRFLAMEIIAKEAPGVLAWAVRGATEWASMGLMQPDSVRKAVAAYRVDQDEFGAFLAERTVSNDGNSIPVRLLYQIYQGWTYTVGVRTMGEHDLIRTLRERHYKVENDQHGSHYVHDLALSQPQPAINREEDS